MMKSLAVFCATSVFLAARVPPRKHLLLSPRSWPCSVQSAQLLPPPPGLAQHFAQHMPPIARTLWACSHLSVAFFQACFHAISVLLRHFAFFLGLDKRFSVYGQQLFVVPVTFHHIFASCQRRFESLPRELCSTTSHFEIECCALDKEAV